MSILVHHLQYSRSLRVLWMLEELGLEYELRTLKRTKAFRAPKEAHDIHPLGRFPIVEVDGLMLIESGAILEHFGEREGKLRPTNAADLVEYRMFMHYAEGSVMPPLLVQLILDKLKSAPLLFFIKPIAKKIATSIEESYTNEQLGLHFGYVDKLLSERPFFAGEEFSLADIQMFYAMEVGLTRGGGERPNIAAWLERMKARPAYITAENKGGPAAP